LPLTDAAAAVENHPFGGPGGRDRQLDAQMNLPHHLLVGPLISIT
jgi:hypothetical protein